MENTADELDDMSSLDYDLTEQGRLLEKFRNRTQVDINEPFYKGSGWCLNLSQLLSIVLGFGVCLHMAHKFPDIDKLIFGACVALLVFVEVGKRFVLGKIGEIKIINIRKKSKRKLSGKPYYLAAVFFFSASIISGYVGSPEIIYEFSKHEPLKELSKAKERYLKRIRDVEAKFGAQKKEVFALAGELAKSGTWEGIIVKDVREQRADLILLGAKKDSLMNSTVLGIQDEMKDGVNWIDTVNKKIIKEHKEWCNTFSLWAVGCVVFLDIVLIVLLMWRYGHEDKKITQNKMKDSKSKEGVQDPDKQGGKFKDEDKDSLNKDTKEGDIKRGEDGAANKITIPLSDGSLKTYKAGIFRSYFNSSGIGRKVALLPFLNKLNLFEGKEEITLEDLT